MRPDVPFDPDAPLPVPADRKPPLVPSHIAWPAFIVLLLAITITMAAVTVIAARSDGGARLVDDAGDPTIVRDATPPAR